MTDDDNLEVTYTTKRLVGRPKKKSEPLEEPLEDNGELNTEIDEDDLPPPPKYNPTKFDVRSKTNKSFTTPNMNSDRPNSIVKQVDYRESSWLSWFTLGGLKKKFNLKFNLERCYLINMELKNGMHTTFIVKEKENTFTYNDKKYTFDDDLKYLHVDTQLYALDYHEDFVMPIKRKIDINEVNRAISGSGITEIEYMTNPSTLERFTVSKIAEGIMKGQQLDEFFRQIRLIVIIGALIGILHLVLFIMKTGMLKSIKIPGISG